MEYNPKQEDVKRKSHFFVRAGLVSGHDEAKADLRPDQLLLHAAQKKSPARWPGY
jgi:hypothetical protein